MHLRLSRRSLWVFSLSLLWLGCDTADQSPASPTDPITATPVAPVGASPLDGKDIVHVDAADIQSGTYASSIRSALAARSSSVVAQLNEVGTAATTGRAAAPETIPLSDLFADAPEARLGPAPSMHLVLLDGDAVDQFALFLNPASDIDGLVRGDLNADDVYVMLDPERFHPDPNNGASAQRTVPATHLATGETASVRLTRRGVEVVGVPDAVLLVLEAVPVLDQVNPYFPGYALWGDPGSDYREPAPCDDEIDLRCSGGGGGGTGSGGTGGGTGGSGAADVPFLSVRTLRINQSFDANGTVSSKNEVQFTAERGDNYGQNFSRFNTRRFDNAFWTASGQNPEGRDNTLNPVYFDGAIQYWMYAADVNYKDRDYDFRGGYWAQVPGVSQNFISGNYDFPLVLLTSDNALHRAYLNEDDADVPAYSRRNGRTWSGTVDTYNFSTGRYEALNTRVSSNDHFLGSDDRVFADSGLRRINATNVRGLTSNGTRTQLLRKDGFLWEVSYQELPF